MEENMRNKDLDLEFIKDKQKSYIYIYNKTKNDFLPYGKETFFYHKEC